VAIYLGMVGMVVVMDMATLVMDMATLDMVDMATLVMDMATLGMVVVTDMATLVMTMDTAAGTCMVVDMVVVVATLWWIQTVEAVSTKMEIAVYMSVNR
jgi:hypothetical protein